MSDVPTFCPIRVIAAASLGTGNDTSQGSRVLLENLGGQREKGAFDKKEWGH